MIPKYLIKSSEMRGVIELARLQGRITKDECHTFYMTRVRINDALKYLVANNLLRKIDKNLYEYVPQVEREQEISDRDKDEDEKHEN